MVICPPEVTILPSPDGAAPEERTTLHARNAVHADPVTAVIRTGTSIALIECDDGSQRQAVGEDAMSVKRRLAIIAAAAILIAIRAPGAEAGGAVGLRIGGEHFGISIGAGDWGLYSNSWYDPTWSLDFDVVLGGYGEWVRVDGLGRCWRPWVAASWQPYSHGRWVHTSHGWTWVAYEPWGYVPHHYGSWARSAFGWVWVPGYSYAAANVVWVRAGSFIGWYARPPHGWSHAAHGFSHGYRHGIRDGYASGYGDGYHDGWRDARYGTWVEWRSFGADNVAQHSVAHAVASRHRVENLAAAPSTAEISRRGGIAVPEARLETRTVRAGGRDVVVARPTGVESSIERHAPATVRTALSGAALENRQPQIRRRAQPSTAAQRSQSAGDSTRSSVPNAGRVQAARAGGSSASVEQPARVRIDTSRSGSGAPLAARAAAPTSASSHDRRAARLKAPARPSAARSASAGPAADPERIPPEARPAERRARPAPSRPPDDDAKAAEPRSRASAAGDDAPEGERRVQRRPVKKRH